LYFLLLRLDVKDPHELVKLSVSADTLKKRAVLPEYINNPSSLYEIFSNSLDLRSIPKKVIRLLICFLVSTTTIGYSLQLIRFDAVISNTLEC